MKRRDIIRLGMLTGVFSTQGFNLFSRDKKNISSERFSPVVISTWNHGLDANKVAWDQIKKTNIWILDALRRTPHQSHTHLSQSLEWIEKSGVKKAVITNMHIDMDYETLTNELPNNVEPAFDGMKIMSKSTAIKE